jgi:uncharacterized oxidoreductase
MSETIGISPAALTEVAAHILRAGGSEEPEARVVSQHLVLANLSGHDSHGVGMLPAYARSLAAGLLFPNREPELVRDDGSILIFDGLRGYGQSVGRQAMQQSLERCRDRGLVLMTLRNAHHLGRIGTYGEMASDAGMVSMHFVNVMDHEPFVAPYLGSDGRFSTNPICLAMPGTSEQPPVILDMATSRIAHGKVRVAHNKGEPVPPGSLIDSEGQPTTDAGVMFRRPAGSLVPFGEHKGYGLAIFSELLGGMLSGGGTLQPENPRQGSIVNNMLTVLVDPARLVDGDWMAREIEAFVDFCKDSPAADPSEPVLVPGDPERRWRRERAASIPVDEESWEQILRAGESLDLARSDLLRIADLPLPA